MTIRATGRRLLTTLAAAATASVAGGCMMLGPDFAEPPTAVNSTWLDGADGRVAADRTDAREWWTAFNDPVLNSLIDTAYRQNLSLQTAGLRVLEARAQLGVAIGGQYPQNQQLDGGTSVNRISERSVNGANTSEFGYSQLNLGGSLAWELDLWGRFRRAIESADASLSGSVASYDDVLVSLTGDVANAYVRYRTLEQRLIISRNNLITQEESLRIAENRFNGGSTSQRDVEQARTVLGATQATIPTITGEMRRTTNAISVLLGMPPSDLSETLGGDSGIPAPPPTIAVGIPADLLRRRPDIRRAEQEAAAQSAQIGFARAELYPAFSLVGNFGFLSTDAGNFNLADIALWKSRTGAFGPSVTWNILNYGQLTNAVRVQDARFQQALTTYQNTVLTAQREVEDALAGFLSAQQRARFLADSAGAARRSLDLALIQYREGLVDFTTVLTAQQDLLTQEDALVVTVGDISLGAVGVYRALGGGWQIREGDEFVPAETRAVMAKRTDWGNLLTPARLRESTESQRNALVRRPDW